MTTIAKSQNKILTGGGKILTLSGQSIIAPPFLWLRADYGVTESGGKVTEWANMASSSHNATQSVSVNQPVLNSSNSNFNNHPTIDFTSPSFLEISASSEINPLNFTYFIVAKRNISTGSFAFISSLALQWYGMQITCNGTNVYFALANGSYSASTVNHNMDNASVITFRTNEGVNNSWINGVPKNSWTKGITYPSTAPINIGKTNLGTANYLEGSIAEIILYNFPLTSGEVNSVNNYLISKYGVL